MRDPVIRDVQPRLRLPATAAKDEVIEIRVLITHAMESGLRKGDDGQPVPRAIVNRFTASFNGTPVLDATIEPGISANPYFAFHARVPESGEFHFTWQEDHGQIHEARHRIKVI